MQLAWVQREPPVANPALCGRSRGLNPWGNKIKTPGAFAALGEPGSAGAFGLRFGLLGRCGLGGVFFSFLSLFSSRIATGGGCWVTPASGAMGTAAADPLARRYPPPFPSLHPLLALIFGGAPSCPEMGVKPPRDAAPPGAGKRRRCLKDTHGKASWEFNLLGWAVAVPQFPRLAMASPWGSPNVLAHAPRTAPYPGCSHPGTGTEPGSSGAERCFGLSLFPKAAEGASSGCGV